MTRLQRILAGILALQLVLTAVILWPRQMETAVASPMFPDLLAADVISLTIADTAGAEIVLARQDNAWVLANGSDYPANATTIEPLLDKIVAMQTGRLVTRTAGSHKQLQVAEDDFVRRVTLGAADGQSYTFYMGSSPSGQGTHVRLSDSNETYLIDGLNVYEVSQLASSWIDTTYMSVDVAAVTAVTLENASGTLQFTRVNTNTWTLADLAAGETFNQAPLDTLLSSLSNLRLTTPLGQTNDPAYGLDAPQAKVTLTLETASASSSYTLLLGANDAEAQTYTVKWSDSPYYVTVSAFAVQALPGYGRADFLTPAATPTP